MRATRSRPPSAALLIAAAIGLSWPHASLASAGLTARDLVTRVQIPLAAISPDGSYAAYAFVRGNPATNRYEVTIRAAMIGHPAPLTLASFELEPEQTFNDFFWLKKSAVAMKWLSADALVFTSYGASGAQLNLWHRGESASRTLVSGHERIELAADCSEGHERGETRHEVDSRDLCFITTDLFREASGATVPADLSWRIEDDYRFYGAFKNPKSGGRVSRQLWRLALSGANRVEPLGPPARGWDTTPEEFHSTAAAATASETEAYLSSPVRRPHGPESAAIQVRILDAGRPDSATSAFRVVVTDAEKVRAITGDVRSFHWPGTRILGWSNDERSVNYVYVTATQSVIANATVRGKVTEILRADALLTQPCPLDEKCQLLSTDGHTALFVRSTNLVPDELIAVALPKRRVSVIEAPNASFDRAAQAIVRFMPVDDEGLRGEAWGRLYLPRNYEQGSRLPLLFTSYSSTPGFSAPVGDEVPILTIVSQGIAVFDLNSSTAVGRISSTGDFDVELERVQRPLQAMRWIARKLEQEGLIDSNRIGIAGVSYGAEIAMYAYWKWDGLRAVSTAGASWDPSLVLFGGLSYARYLEKRGFPPAYGDVQQWQRIAAGLNARADLPPLLIQAPESEAMATVPSWFQLRSAGSRVELQLYAKEGHVKRGPATRWWVYERNSDWFRFWLRGEEDSSPEKQAQYVRWRTLRDGAGESRRP